MGNNKGGSRKRRRSQKQIAAAIKVAVVKIGSVAVRVPTQTENVQDDVIANIVKETGISESTVRNAVFFDSIPDDIGDRLFVKCQR